MLAIKGLELQETSCHAVEATAIDDALERAFEAGESHRCHVTPFLSILGPCEATLIETYSDARSQLTGVIDSPEVLQSIPGLFMKALLWVVLKYVSGGERVSKVAAEMPQDGVKNKVKATEISAEDGEKDTEERPNVEKSGSDGGLSDKWATDDDSLFEEFNVKADHSSEKPKPTGRSTSSVGLTFSKMSKFHLPSVESCEVSSNLIHGFPAGDVTLAESSAFTNVHFMHFECPFSSALKLPPEWQGTVSSARKSSSLTFPHEWYQHVISGLVISSCQGKDVCATPVEVANDKMLEKMYNEFCATITSMALGKINSFLRIGVISSKHEEANSLNVVVFNYMLTGDFSDSPLMPMFVYKFFNGNTLWNMSGIDDDLNNLILKSFR